MLGTGAGIVAQLGVFLFGAYLAVTKQGVTPGVVIVFLPLMSFVVDPIGSVPPILANRRAAVALIDKLADAVEKTSARAANRWTRSCATASPSTI